MPLYHYTCQHGHEGILRDGVIRSAVTQLDQAKRRALRKLGIAAVTSQVVWLTTLPHVVRLNINQVGLGMYEIERLTGAAQCDRSAHRYEITEENVIIKSWAEQRRIWPIAVVQSLESLPGARPDTWWISRGPLHARYSPHRSAVAV